MTAGGTDQVEPVHLTPIGYVRSPVRPGERMPVDGVPASVEIAPEFVDGLADITANSHVWILGWFDHADRSRVLLSREPKPRGVFSVRSAARPNPIGLMPARVVGLRGDVLELDRLDFFDGTPVLDIKRYSPGWDAIFSASTARDLRAPENALGTAEEWLNQAERFRGGRTPDLAAGVRCLLEALAAAGIGPRDPRVAISVPAGSDAADALQALTGASFGNGRLSVSADGTIEIDAAGVRHRYRLRNISALAPEQVLSAPFQEIAEILDPR